MNHSLQAEWKRILSFIISRPSWHKLYIYSRPNGTRRTPQEPWGCFRWDLARKESQELQSQRGHSAPGTPSTPSTVTIDTFPLYCLSSAGAFSVANGLRSHSKQLLWMDWSICDVSDEVTAWKHIYDTLIHSHTKKQFMWSGLLNDQLTGIDELQMHNVFLLYSIPRQAGIPVMTVGSS